MSSSSCYFFAQCNAMVDLVVDVDDEFIASTKGVIRGQAQLADSDEQVQKVFADACAKSSKKPRITPGGSGLATARCVNWMLQGNGAQQKDLVSVLSVINEGDEYGKLMKQSLSSEGVETSCLFSLAVPSSDTPPRATGCCLVLVTPDGERTMLVTIGAWQNLDIFDKLRNDPVASSELMKSVPALSQSQLIRAAADIQYATGFAVVASGAFLLHSSLGFNFGENSAASSACSSAATSPSSANPVFNCRFCNGSPIRQKKDQILAGNISAQYVVDAFNASLVEFLTEADLVFSNFDEAKALAASIIKQEKQEERDFKNPTDVAEFLARFFLNRRSISSWRCDGCLRTNEKSSSKDSNHNDDRHRNAVAAITVVVTNGSSAIGICSAGAATNGSNKISANTQLYPVPPLTKEQQIVDTCNAGDCFVGGFFAGMKLFHEEEDNINKNLSVGAAWHRGVRKWIDENESEEKAAFRNWLARCVLLGTRSAAVVICQSGCTLPSGAAPLAKECKLS